MTLKLSILATMCLIIVGCQRSKPDTMTMLRSGSQKVCVADDVEETLRSMILPKPAVLNGSLTNDAEKSSAIARTNIPFELTTMTDFDKEVSRASCSMTIKVAAPDGTSSSFDASFTISPSAKEETAFIISANTGQAQAAALTQVYTQLAALVQKRLAVETALQTGRDRAELLKVINSGWLVGQWIGSDAPKSDCAEGLLTEYKRGGQFSGYESSGLWSLEQDKLLVAGEGEGERFSRRSNITAADANSFTEKADDGTLVSFVRCSTADLHSPISEQAPLEIYNAELPTDSSNPI